MSTKTYLPHRSFNLSPQLLRQVELKYGSSILISPPPPPQNLLERALILIDIKASAPVGRSTGQPGITFDRFVRACVAIKQMTEAFQRFDTQRTGWVQMNYDQFMETVLRLP
jgi:hypothetical protein